MGAGAVTPSAPDTSVIFTAALLKIASRCNLNCDYCYVYKHVDQSWRNQPHFMSDATIKRFAERLDEYVSAHSVQEFSVTFHGGEPLLYGANRLAEATALIRSIVAPQCKLEFSLQTNGTLLSDDAIDELEAAFILVSLSVDGPERVNDLHRLNHSGSSTFAATMSAIDRLNSRTSGIFRGVISVIDPVVSPRELFEFFQPLDLPQLDLLLPDATHATPPFGRDTDPQRYSQWLTAAFELWFREFSDIPIRWFDALLGSRLGIPSPTDAMGMGSVNLIVIDTDGSYTDHDVFKITQENGAALQRDLLTTSFHEVSGHPHILLHARSLRLEGLASECQTCPVVDACGGGSVMHRWHPQRQLDAPSAYCGELFQVLGTATRLMRTSLRKSRPNSEPYSFPLGGRTLVDACRAWRRQTETLADKLAADGGFRRNNVPAAAILLWSKAHPVGQPPLGQASLGARPWLHAVRVQSNEPWLVRPFLESIKVLSIDSNQVQVGRELLERAIPYLEMVDEFLPNAFAELVSDVLFVESTIEAADQIFSFSDDSAPNVLYIAPTVGSSELAPDDFADSLLHEFLHQTLYHMDAEERMLLDNVFPYFPAPWRPGLRPAAGFFHGTFVFSGLARLWNAIARSDPNNRKAQNNSMRFREQASYGVQTLRQFALTTERGESLLAYLAEGLELSDQPITAPGILN